MNIADLAVVGTCCMIAGFVIDRLIHPGRRISRRLEEFFEDWNGEPERRSADGSKVLKEREPGVVETLKTHTEDIASIKAQLNGGGLGTQMTQLEGKTDDLSGEVQAVKEQVAEIQRFGFRLAQGQERLEAQVASVDGAIRHVHEKVDGRLFDLEESERTHRAALHELGYPTSPDEAPDLD